ncbi:MAG: hypothetical protein KGS61_07970 [Verrucomicrobia bacterium]|nr:hypothetical protein [Verrucomicrobiota bacterium]
MKAKTAVPVVLCVVLAGAFLWRHLAAEKQQEENEARVLQLSNEWVQTSAKLNDVAKTNTLLQTDLSFRTDEIHSLSNKLERVSSELSKSQTEAKAAAEAAQEAMARRDARITQLEEQRDDLGKQMTNLSLSITNLEGQIQETQRKLAASEGDREFLLKELKRLQTEKAALEKQMNDLAFLRSQVRKLRDELAIARRLDWIRRGLFGFPAKGGELMQSGFATAGSQTNFNLNVEIKRQGGATILPSATDAPAKTNAPAK